MTFLFYVKILLIEYIFTIHAKVFEAGIVLNSVDFLINLALILIVSAKDDNGYDSKN